MNLFQRRPKSPSPIRRSKPIGSRIAELLERFQEGGRIRQREHRLRRMRRERQRADRDEQTSRPVKRSPLQAWLHRQRLKRATADQNAPWSIRSLVVPRSQGIQSSAKDAAAKLMRHSSIALLLLLAASLILNSVPLRLTNPSWYLSILYYISENVPVIIFLVIISVLSLALDSDYTRSNTYRLKLRRFLSIGYFVALILIPIQIALSAWLFSSTFGEFRTQVSFLRVETNALVTAATSTANTEEFIGFLRARNLTANLQSIANAPLDQVKSEFINGVKLNAAQQENQIAATARRTYLRFAINAVKLFLYFIALTLLLRVSTTFTAQISLASNEIEAVFKDDADASNHL
jgi:hypothetical protein